MMKTPLLLFLLSTIPLMGTAQDDAVPSPPPLPEPPVEDTIGAGEEKRAVHLSWSSKEGAQVGIVEPEDTTKRKDPVIIELKNRTLRIYSDDKHVATDSVRIAERIKELRTNRRNLFTYWAGLDIGMNTLLGPDGSSYLDKDAAFMRIDEGRRD